MKKQKQIRTEAAKRVGESVHIDWQQVDLEDSCLNSGERKRYVDFDSGSLRSPNVDWAPPYPYCPDDVLFPVEEREVEFQALEKLPRHPFAVALQEHALWKQLPADDSPGG
jgi:hypothetical protein